jgi:hypothetical protein
MSPFLTAIPEKTIAWGVCLRSKQIFEGSNQRGFVLGIIAAILA